MVTRAYDQSSGFASILKSHGANTILFPTIRVVSPKSYRRLDQSIRNLNSYDWLIFTSVNGVEWFIARFKRIFRNEKFPNRLKTCAIGPATAGAMIQLGLPVTKISKKYVAESILKEITKPKGKKILIPRASVAREVLPISLRNKGAQVDVVEAYRTIPESTYLASFRNFVRKSRIDCITFTSSSTVQNFFSLLSNAEREKLKKNAALQIASIGPITTRTLKDHRFPPDIVALKPTTKHLARAIVKFYFRVKSCPALFI